MRDVLKDLLVRAFDNLSKLLLLCRIIYILHLLRCLPRDPSGPARLMLPFASGIGSTFRCCPSLPSLSPIFAVFDLGLLVLDNLRAKLLDLLPRRLLRLLSHTLEPSSS